MGRPFVQPKHLTRILVRAVAPRLMIPGLMVAGLTLLAGVAPVNAAQAHDKPQATDVAPPPPIPVPPVVYAAPPPPRPAALPADAQLSFVAADYARGQAVFVEDGSIDRADVGKVHVRTVYVLRRSGFEGLPRYERAAQDIDCTGEPRKLMRKMSRSLYREDGAFLGQKTMPGHYREPVPETVDPKLWQFVCAAPQVNADVKTVTGIAAAMALFDPMLEVEDDRLAAGGATAPADDKARDLYDETRRKELATGSQTSVLLLWNDYKTAADGGSRRAMWRLYALAGPLKIPGGNEPWLRRLAEAGDARAQYMLGASLFSKTAPCDESRTWMERSASQGYLEAQTAMGIYLERGLCGSAAVVEAAEWYEKAARRGDFDAQLHLGRMYEEGRGVKLSTREGGAWYLIARGHSPWEEGIDQFRAAVSLQYMSNFGQTFILVLGDYPGRARELCKQDEVCRMVVVEDVGAHPQ